MSRPAFTASSLDIRGYRDEGVPHTFFRQAAGAGHLAMIFPGLGYRARMPLTTEPTLAGARAVWLTPLFRLDSLRGQIRQSRPRSLVVVGTADPEYDPAHLADVRAATACECVLVEGADHSLEIPGDVPASLKAMERVMRALQAFMV